MGKAAVVMGILGAMGYATWKYFEPPSEAATAYATFSDAMARDDFAKAAEYATGAVAQDVAARLAALPRRGVQGEFESRRRMEQRMERGSSNGTTHEVLEEEETDDGKIEIEAIRRDARSGSGMRGIQIVKHRHRVVLENVEGGWRVMAFEEEPLP